MDARDHIKNGTSLKIKLKKLFLGVALLCAVVVVAYGQQYDSENDFEVIERNEDVFIFKYNGTKQTVNIPSTIQDMNVIFIGAHAFKNKNISDVTIPNNVTSIRASAFLCNNLTSVTIPNGVTFIDATAFTQNPIISITIGANVKFRKYKELNGNTYKFAFDNGFDNFYIKQGRRAGTYTYSNGVWNMIESKV